MEAWAMDNEGSEALSGAVTDGMAGSSPDDDEDASLQMAVAPDEGVVDHVLQREMQAEAQRLQVELNTRKIERKSRQEKFEQLQMSLQMISAEKSPSTATEMTAYLQHQLWAIEQATQAERKYDGSLRSLISRAKDERRAVQQETNALQRAVAQSKRDAARASQRGEKMRVCRERASTDLRRLKQTIERTNRERMDRFMELARTHVTATEIQKQMKERQKRATDITLEIAGDLDENGEAELRCAVHSLDAKRIQTRREVLDTFSNEAYLKGVITQLREVTGVYGASDMLARYFSQQELFAELQQKQDEKAEIVERMRNQLEEMQANKLNLAGHLEEETARLSTSSLLDDAQQRVSVAQKKLDKGRKKFTQLEVVLVEAKEVMLRIERAALPLASLESPDTNASVNDNPDVDTDLCIDGAHADGGAERHDAERVRTTDELERLRNASLPASWEMSNLQIMRQLESTAQLLMERFNELVPRSRTLQQFVLRPHNVRVALLEADATADPANNSGHGVPPGSDEAHASLEATTPQSTDSTVAVNTVGPQGRAPSFPQHRKPGRRRANGTGRRRNLSPLKGGKPLRKPLSKLRGGNSTVSATF